jgi:prolyl-tRNA editing enzyme YbaK/EbsC (Cys-tRNA(Pro) deacylase)
MTEQKIQRLKAVLDEAGAAYEISAQPEIIRSSAEGVESGIGQLDEMAPTLILETERGCLVAIINGSTRLSYRKIKKALKLRNVALASPEVALQTTGAAVGTISLINPGLPTILDTQLAEVVYGGCGVPGYTLRITRPDLIRITEADVFDFTEPKAH